MLTKLESSLSKLVVGSESVAIPESSDIIWGSGGIENCANRLNEAKRNCQGQYDAQVNRTLEAG
jgi:hypothetical protein